MDEMRIDEKEMEKQDNTDFEVMRVRQAQFRKAVVIRWRICRPS